ncbi:MAG: integrase core domain-containing protein [Acidiferrobacteraceae bacterium]
MPLSHPFIERLIGTLRREFLDQILFWSASDLEKELSEFKEYYNGHPVHAALGGKTPEQMGSDRPPTTVLLDQFAWASHCHGLYHTPVAA